MKKWKVGSGRAPDWIKERLMLYLRADGAVGYEIQGRGLTLHAKKGDVVTMKDNGDIKVEAVD